MVYICENCGLLFSRVAKEGRCPDCGKPSIRFANEAERHKFAANVAEQLISECAQAPRFPHLVEIGISMLNCFTFQLPVTALQIDNSMVVDIVVNFGESSTDSNDLTANVWAQEADGLTLRFLMPIHIPAQKDEPLKGQVSRLFAVLNGNETFKSRLYDFVMKQLRRREG